MCRDVDHGGRRCPQSTKIATIRRTTRRQLMKANPGVAPYRIAEAQHKAVEKYLRANPDAALEMLPEKNDFNAHGRVDVSVRRLKAFVDSHFSPITASKPPTVEMAEEFEQLEEHVWSTEEVSEVHQYTVAGFERLNAYLRNKNFFRKMMKEAVFSETYQDAKENVLKHIGLLSSAIEKGQRLDRDPRKVYRYVRLPDGVSPGEYVNRYIQPGNIMKNPGFLSTSADPGFVLTHMLVKPKQRYVVLEILTKQGVSVQQDKESSSGDVQSLEHEVLMPTAAEFAVVDVSKRSSITVEEDVNPALNRYLSRYGLGRDGLMNAGRRHSVTVVRLADVDLVKSDA